MVGAADEASRAKGEAEGGWVEERSARRRVHFVAWNTAALFAAFALGGAQRRKIRIASRCGLHDPKGTERSLRAPLLVAFAAWVAIQGTVSALALAVYR